MIKLPRSSPEEQGIPAQAISSFLAAVEREGLELHSLMLLRRGHVVAEGWWHPYDADGVHLLYSLSKSFTVTAVGMAVEESLLSVEDSVISFFPDDAPETVGEHLATMKVKHLLSMATGHVTDTIDRIIPSDNWAKTFLAIPPDKAPGSVFCYNNGSTYMLSAMLHKLTGASLIEYLKPRLLEPLGIEKARWQENSQGIQLGFSGLHVTTDAIAKFGQLYLQKGTWQDQQLIPEAWVEAAVTKHITSASPGQEANKVDWQQGYGYQFWRCRHGAYRGDGAFGQFCVVLPEQDAVFVTTSGEDDMQAILNAVWEHLLPAMQESALEPDRAAQKVLQAKLDSLNHAPVQGEMETATSRSVQGMTYAFEDIDLTPEAAQNFKALLPKSLSLEKLGLTQNEHWRLTYTNEESVQLDCGFREWSVYSSSFFGDPEQVAVSAAWTAEDRFTARLRRLETPHWLELELRFVEDAVNLNMRWNVAFGTLDAPQFIGKQLGR